MTEITHLTVGMIRRDGGTQTRATLNEEAVEQYAEILASGEHFSDPVVVFHDGKDHWLADGFHRVEAHERSGILAVRCVVKQGTRRDAILYSVGANAAHGLRRTNADKRRAVETLLADDEWAKRSNAWIAEQCRVGVTLVAGLRRDEPLPANRKEPAEKLGSNHQADTREGLDGKLRPKPGTATSPGADRKRKTPAPKHSEPVCEDELFQEEEETSSVEVRFQEEESEAERSANEITAWKRTPEFQELITTASRGLVSVAALDALRLERESDREYKESRESERAIYETIPMSRDRAIIDFALSGGELAMAELGLNYRSTLADLKSVYRREAMHCHPDRGGNQEAMARLNAANALVLQFLTEIESL